MFRIVKIVVDNNELQHGNELNSSVSGVVHNLHIPTAKSEKVKGLQQGKKVRKRKMSSRAVVLYSKQSVQVSSSITTTLVRKAVALLKAEPTPLGEVISGLVELGQSLWEYLVTGKSTSTEVSRKAVTVPPSCVMSYFAGTAGFALGTATGGPWLGVFFALVAGKIAKETGKLLTGSIYDLF